MSRPCAAARRDSAGLRAPLPAHLASLGDSYFRPFPPPAPGLPPALALGLPPPALMVRVEDRTELWIVPVLPSDTGTFAVATAREYPPRETPIAATAAALAETDPLAELLTSAEAPATENPPPGLLTMAPAKTDPLRGTPGAIFVEPRAVTDPLLAFIDTVAVGDPPEALIAILAEADPLPEMLFPTFADAV